MVSVNHSEESPLQATNSNESSHRQTDPPHPPLDDCGIKSLGWCRSSCCQKLACLSVFVCVLACSGLLQGFTESYFRLTVLRLAHFHDYPNLVVEWLQLGTGLTGALFALMYVYWANRYHAIGWFSGTLLLQSVSSLLMVIPSIMDFSQVSNNKQRLSYVSEDTCSPSSTTTTTTNSSQFISPKVNMHDETLTIVLLFVLQLFLSLSSVAFYAIGLLYIDNNCSSRKTMPLIAAVLAFKIIGNQMGLWLYMGAWWWLIWIILSILTAVNGVVIGLFPRQLQRSKSMRKKRPEIHDDTRHSFTFTFYQTTTFCSSMRRLLFANKLFWFLLLSLTFISAAYLNFALEEDNYVQSRFFIPYNIRDGLQQEWRERFLSAFLQYPAIAISMLIACGIMAKIQLSASGINILNFVMTCLMVIMFILAIFVDCEVGPLAGVTRGGRILQPYCSHQCICPTTTFAPVCPDNSTVTYLSACFAGCSKDIKVDATTSQWFYDDCTCSQTGRVTATACSATDCYRMFLLFEILRVATSAIMGIIILGKILMILRCVALQDKSLAVAIVITFIGLVTYLPVRATFITITRETCHYWTGKHNNKCLLNLTPLHGNLLNYMSIILLLVGVIFDFLCCIYGKHVNIFKCKMDNDFYSYTTTEDLMRREQTASTQVEEMEGAEEAPTNANTNTNGNVNEISGNGTTFDRPEVENISNGNGDTIDATPSVIKSPDGITYAQISFPPQPKIKLPTTRGKQQHDDGTDSDHSSILNKSIVAPLHYLSVEDVRQRLQTLRSFQNTTNSIQEVTTTTTTTSAVILSQQTDKSTNSSSSSNSFNNSSRIVSNVPVMVVERAQSPESHL